MDIIEQWIDLPNAKLFVTMEDAPEQVIEVFGVDFLEN